MGVCVTDTWRLKYKYSVPSMWMHLHFTGPEQYMHTWMCLYVFTCMCAYVQVCEHKWLGKCLWTSVGVVHLMALCILVYDIQCIIIHTVNQKFSNHPYRVLSCVYAYRQNSNIVPISDYPSCLYNALWGKCCECEDAAGLALDDLVHWVRGEV